MKSTEIAEELRGLLGYMLVLVGKRTQEVKDMSVKFIRWVLGLMIKSLLQHCPANHLYAI